MNIPKFINSLIRDNLISEEKIVSQICTLWDTINLRQYRQLVDTCNRFGIDKAEVFKHLFINSSEDVQYQMWKDGYVEVCPANRLLQDIEDGDAEISEYILNNYDNNLPHCEAYFCNIQDVVLDYITQAKETIKIAMAWFTNPIIFNRLLRACNRGIDVCLLINNDLINNRYNGLPFDKLIESGARLFIAEAPKLIHHKFCIIDDRIVIDGSYNWTILAEKNNDENIVVLKNGNVILSFIDAFDHLIRENQKVEKMPLRVPEKPEYDCCSYKNINSTEWIEQIESGISKKKEHDIYKHIYVALPEELAKEKIPSSEFDRIKSEVEEEKTKDFRLFQDSINQTKEELATKKAKKEHEITTVSTRISFLTASKGKISDRCQRKIELIKKKKISHDQKEAQINSLKKERRREIQKITRTISIHNSQLSILDNDRAILESQQNLISEILDTDLKGSNGLCRINLKWQSEDDLDLHLILPKGSIDSDTDIYYSHMRSEYNGGICSLDHDAIPNSSGENPQENIIWENCIPDGTYKIVVKLFNKKSDLTNIPFSVSIFSGDLVKTQVFNFNEATSKDTIEIANLTFKKGKLLSHRIFR